MINLAKMAHHLEKSLGEGYFEDGFPNLLLMAEILHHLGCMKPYK